MVLDQAVLQQSCGGDDEFARELFVEYHQRVLELVAEMTRSASAGQSDVIRKAAHELKGSSLTLGALQIAKLSKDLEDRCREGDSHNLVQSIQEIDNSAQELFAHLKTLNYL